MSKAFTSKVLKHDLKHFVPPSNMTSDLVESFYESLNTPKSLACLLLFKAGEHDQLLDVPCDPLHYLTAEGFHLDYSAVSFLSKSAFLTTTHDKKARAIEKFQSMELLCQTTNQRFRLEPEQQTHVHGHLLLAMRRKIDSILGEFNVEEFFRSPAWGPGSTTLVKGVDVSSARKFQSETGITIDLYTLMQPCLQAAYPLWWSRECLNSDNSSITLEVGNTVVTVPKNSKIDRVIAIEPGLNQFFQKSVGKMMRRRLKRWQVDLSSQTRNQELARRGSVSNRIATVDFSSASDTIAKEVVRNLLPYKWWLILDHLRCKRGRIDDVEFCWEKFSSMGNGFTFELETLIFFVCALVCCEAVGCSTQDVSVYGDDVIIPSQAYNLFSEVALMLGFLVGPKKSFSTGPFRESCGSHYFRGVDVKPIFLKEKLSNAFSLYKLANSVRRLAHRCGFNYSCDARFLPTWRSCVQGLPRSLRSVKIPEGYGDGGISSNFDEACPSVAKDGHEGFTIRMFAERGIKVPHDSRGLLLSRLHSLGLAENDYQDRPIGNYLRMDRLSTLAYRNEETLRDRTRPQLTTGVLVPSWYNFGCWQL